MSGRISNDDVQYIRHNAPIDDVIGQYTQLKNAGGGAKKGLCPFHDEKSPSFHVTPSKGYYHCFGCGKGGDVISFLMEKEHLSFTETIERLAERMNYILRYEEGSSSSRPASNRKRLLEAHALAAKFYQDQLNTSADAQAARELLTKRGFDREACATFKVGYAPNSWDALTKHLKGLGFTVEELEQAGLSKMGDRGPIDKFRNRVMWPISDIVGDVIGFGARKLASDAEDQGPKYLNTAETPIYKKSNVLYGLDMAKKEIAKKRQVVVVEGYTDVMACHIAGITTAVATCGTAFGPDHIQILRKLLMDESAFRGEVIFTFDGDEAGQKAALKAFQDDQKFMTQTFVAVEPDGLDPCDLRQQKGDLALRDLIARRVPLFEFAIRTQIKKYDLNNAEGRVAALNATAPLVSNIRDISLRPEYIKLLAGWLGSDVDIVRAAVNKEISKSAPAASAPAAKVNPQDPTVALEREVIKVRLQHPALMASWASIEPDAFTHPAYALFAKAVTDLGIMRAPSLDDFTDENMRAVFTELSVEPIMISNEVTINYVESLVARLREVRTSRIISDLKSRLQRLNPVENEAEYTAAFTELVTLEKQRQELHKAAFTSLY